MSKLVGVVKVTHENPFNRKFQAINICYFREVIAIERVAKSQHSTSGER